MFPHSKQLLIGLPCTGKTTFIAALWQVVEAGDVPGALRLKTLHGNRNHLNFIHSQWLKCQQLARTTFDSWTVVSMMLSDDANGRTTEVFLPDLSGETFDDQWRERKWSNDYDKLVNEASGTLVFVHPDMVVEPTRINTADQLLAAIEDDGKTQGLSEQDTEEPWDARSAPTQVKLVELLQFHAARRDVRSTLRVALIVSAWDLVRNAGQTPEQWIASRLPLLDQFLKANHEQFPTACYGLSAQGGELPEDEERLLTMHRPSERIIMISQVRESHDVTLPIKWLMG